MNWFNIRIRRLWEALGFLRISTKFSILLIILLLIPVVSFTETGFSLLYRNLIREREDTARLALEKSLLNVSDAVDSCSLLAEIILANDSLPEELGNLRGLNQPAAALNFKQGPVFQIDGMVKANPVIRSARLYVNDSRIPKLVPVLYQYEQARRQNWYTTPLRADNTWYFNQEDRVSENFEQPGEELLAVNLHELRDEARRVYGVLEISTPMEMLFQDLYQAPSVNWMGYVDGTGSLYYNKSDASMEWRNMIGSIVYSMADSTKNYTSAVLNLGNHAVLAAGIPVNKLGGHLIRAALLDDVTGRIRRYRLIIYVILLVTFYLCTKGIQKMVSVTTERLRHLLGVTQELQRGNLNVDIPEMGGGDEIGELAVNFKAAVERVRMLLKQSVQRELLVKNTEIRTLQNQINAHFIYNILESIKMMAEIDEKYDISDAVTSLGILLRYSMRWASSMAPLRDELEYIENYINLINLRYDFKIDLTVSVPAPLYNQSIPKMSLQPIIENAVYHGIEPLGKDAVIQVNAVEYDAFCEIEITDTGVGMNEASLSMLRKQVDGHVREAPQRGNGIGLKNVQERVRFHYGNEYGLRFNSLEGCYTKVIVKLPLLREGESNEQASDR